MELRQKNAYVASIAKYADALEEVFRDRQTDYASSSLRAEVRRAIDGKSRPIPWPGRDVCSLLGSIVLILSRSSETQRPSTTGMDVAASHRSAYTYIPYLTEPYPPLKSRAFS